MSVPSAVFHRVAAMLVVALSCSPMAPVPAAASAMDEHATAMTLSDWLTASTGTRHTVAMTWLQEWDSTMQRHDASTLPTRAETLVACVNNAAKPETESQLAKDGASLIAKNYASACVMMLNLW